MPDTKTWEYWLERLLRVSLTIARQGNENHYARDYEGKVDKAKVLRQAAYLSYLSSLIVRVVTMRSVLLSVLRHSQTIQSSADSFENERVAELIVEVG